MRPLTFSQLQPRLKYWLVLAALLISMPAQAAIQCFLTRNLPSIFFTGPQTNLLGNLFVNCIRDSLADPSSITYRITASEGLHSTAAQPLRRLANTNTPPAYIAYSLRRPSVVGSGNQSCGSTSNWLQPSLGDSETFTGTFSFIGNALNGNNMIAICAQLQSTPSPAAGQYSDTVQFQIRYPNSDTGKLGSLVPVSFNAAVGDACRLTGGVTSFPALPYEAFSVARLRQTNSVSVICNTSKNYTLSISPNKGVVAGLQYWLGWGTAPTSLNAPPPSTPTSDLSSSITGSFGTARTHGYFVYYPAGQAGTCAANSCTDFTTHQMIISY